MIVLTLFFTSCGNDYHIKYDGPDVVNIVLMEDFDLGIESDEPLTYRSDNELYVTISPEGVIHGKNIGEANIIVSNEENEMTIHVIVSLFEEPSLKFGSSPDYIKSIYGEPSYNLGDSVLVYGSGNDWYSYAVWEMDFFFLNNQYFESDLYIRKDLDLRINQYLDENYFKYDTITDTIPSGEIATLYLYLNNSNADNANVVVGKQYNAGPYDDICLFYAPWSNSKSDKQMILSRNRKKQ